MFIDFLEKKYELKRKRTKGKKSIANQKFVDVWEDRKDLEDSSTWVRNIR